MWKNLRAAGLAHILPDQATARFYYLAEGPGELHVLARGVAALQQSRPAVDVHQTLVVVVVDGGAQDSEVELLGAGVVDILRGRRAETEASQSELRLFCQVQQHAKEFCWCKGRKEISSLFKIRKEQITICILKKNSGL